MTVVEIIYAVAAVLSGLAAVLAWLAKIRWAKEFRDAKEAEISALKGQVVALKDAKEAEVSVMRAHISALEAQIAGIQRISPPILLEWVESILKIQKIAEEQIEALKQEGPSREPEKTALELAVRIVEESLALQDEISVSASPSASPSPSSSASPSV